MNAPRIFLLAILPSRLPMLDTRTAVTFSSWWLVFTYRLLPVFQLSFGSRLGIQLNNTNLAFLSCLLQNHSLTLKVLGQSSRPLSLQMAQKQ